MKNEGIKVIALNKKASYDYFLFDKYEAGLVLEGSEIKSIREGRVNLKDSYVQVKNGEAFIINMHIANYEKSSFFLPSTTRTRKLLLNKKEILKALGIDHFDPLQIVEVTNGRMAEDNQYINFVYESRC